MVGESTETPQTNCRSCGFEAPAGSDQWELATHPTLGRVSRCPECGSTDLYDQA